MTLWGDTPTSAVKPMALVRELFPAVDPLAALRRLARLPFSMAFLSQGPSSDRGRYSYVMADPVRWIISQGGVCRNSSGQVLRDPWGALREVTIGGGIAPIPVLPPFQGGWAGMLGYDLGRWLEDLPQPVVDDFCPPELVVCLYDMVLATDRLTGRQWIVSSGITNGLNGPSVDSHVARERLAQFSGWLREAPLPLNHSFPSGVDCHPARLRPLVVRPGVFSHFNRSEYLRVLARGIDYIHAGDCFQVNLAQRLLHADRPPLGLLENMVLRNPAPFAGWLDWGGGQVISASPERFLRLQNGLVSTRPIKGTRPRGNNAEEDKALVDELSGSPKDRAENVMIVDLLRNDLGRSCLPGSIAVPTVCEVESFPTVHHMVSEVLGRVRPGCSPVDLLAGAFPGGSVTGAPKVRAMEIIAELEETRRGAYCGSFFWIGVNGAMDSNILIRTITRQGGWLSFPVGGGIVADSNPESEYLETLYKAEGIFRSLD